MQHEKLDNFFPVNNLGNNILSPAEAVKNVGVCGLMQISLSQDILKTDVESCKALFCSNPGPHS